MKKNIPLFFFLITILFFWQVFLRGFLPIPSDALVGLYHPFRDLYAEQYPRGIPFKNFLITDPIRQQYPWRELSISLEKNFQLPLWNPYSFSGYPLLANFQSGTLYPLNIFFFFMPFSVAWSFLIILQPLLGGVFLYVYLRNLKLHPLASFLGGVVFAFSGFSIAWLEWGTVVQTLLWLPLMLLCIDKVFSMSKNEDRKWKIENRALWLIILIASLICSFFAGHLQTFFYLFITQLLYAAARIFQLNKKLKHFLLFTISYMLLIIITAIQWIPTLQFILLSARSIDQNYLTIAGWFLPYQHLLQFIVPDFFGNPATLNYWGVWNYGEFIGYIGIVPLLFAFFAVITRHDKKTYFFSAVALIGLLFALPTPLGILPYALHIPFLSTSQPTRLMGIIDLCLAVLAALGIDAYIKKSSLSMLGILGSVGAMLGVIWIIVIKFYMRFGILTENAHIARQNLLFPTLLFLVSGLILVVYIFTHNNRKLTLLLRCIIIVIVLVDLLRFGWKFTPFTPSPYLYPQTPAITFLQKNIGNYRFMTTDSRILPPNVSDVYALQSIEGYDPLYLQSYGGFIAAMQRDKPDISTPFGFNRIITPHNAASTFINLLGVKYILSLNDIQQVGLRKVYTEGLTKIYENDNVLPRAFFVKQIIPAFSQQDAINKLYTYKNKLKNIAIVSSSIEESKFITDGSDVSIYDYSANNISLLTNAKTKEFLVLTDIYYPTWHAYIDGKEIKIYKTDFTFRGIVVPPGTHTIVFEDHIL